MKGQNDRFCVFKIPTGRTVPTEAHYFRTNRKAREAVKAFGGSSYLIIRDWSKSQWQAHYEGQVSHGRLTVSHWFAPQGVE
jgi:hypothetical protein